MVLYVIYYTFLALSIYAGYLDATSSDRGVYFGTLERNKMVRSQYGLHSDKKEWIWWGPIYAAFAIAPLLPGTTQSWTNWAVSFVCFSLSGWRLNEYYRNHKKQRENRVRQLSVINDTLKPAIATGDPAQIKTAFDLSSSGYVNYNPIVTISGRTAYQMFLWLYSDQPNLDLAVAEIQGKIVDWINAGAVFPE